MVASPDWTLRAIALLTQAELARDPRDIVANAIFRAAEHVSLGGERFAAAYLLSHGAIKIALVIALLKDKLWAYPTALVVFGGFILYQLYRFTVTQAAGLVALSLFDAAMIWLIALEYRASRRRLGRA